MSPAFASQIAWDIWGLSWILVAFWSRRTLARPSRLAEAAHWIPTVIGGALLFFGSLWSIAGRLYPALEIHVASLPTPVSWLMTGLCLAGFAICWWARLTLGDLWSGTVSRKENHEIVTAGPYRFVRHPIYTGILLASFAFALQIGWLPNLIGACLMTCGFWIKARLEERFLSEELGAAAYADYRRKTPMLVPFWPMPG